MLLDIKPDAIIGGMPHPYPLQRKLIVRDYAIERLRRECADAPRGYQTRIQEEAGIDQSHISAILRGKRPAGTHTLTQLAKFWGMTYAQLEAEALGLKEPVRAEQGPPSVALTAALAKSYLPHELKDAIANYVRRPAAEYPPMSEEAWTTVLTGVESALDWPVLKHAMRYQEGKSKEAFDEGEVAEEEELVADEAAEGSDEPNQ